MNPTHFLPTILKKGSPQEKPHPPTSGQWPQEQLLQKSDEENLVRSGSRLYTQIIIPAQMPCTLPLKES